jgi:hypothetical protein
MQSGGTWAETGRSRGAAAGPAGAGTEPSPGGGQGVRRSPPTRAGPSTPGLSACVGKRGAAPPIQQAAQAMVQPSLSLVSGDTGRRRQRLP